MTIQFTDAEKMLIALTDAQWVADENDFYDVSIALGKIIASFEAEIDTDAYKLAMFNDEAKKIGAEIK